MKTEPRYVLMWLPVSKRSWHIFDRIEGGHARGADGKALTFNTPEEAYNRIKKLERHLEKLVTFGERYTIRAYGPKVKQRRKAK